MPKSSVFALITRIIFYLSVLDAILLALEFWLVLSHSLSALSKDVPLILSIGQGVLSISPFVGFGAIAMGALIIKKIYDKADDAPEARKYKEWLFALGIFDVAAWALLLMITIASALVWAL